MKILLQNSVTKEVILYEVVDAHLIDSETMAYLVHDSNSQCYNMNPVHFRD